MSLAALRWRCRRGMLELDAWLQGFAAAGLTRLSPHELDAFARLLQHEDVELYAWLSGRAPPPTELTAMVERIRTATLAPTGNLP
ncbi:MAG: succinate dehydrogenase assembly factor 2 [Thiobacillaceae bacterium]|nr:succinate dehydrogenase assembly factor 2 [Thiobacillaceae bacterium]MDW8324512.1 succinate dehydrogenase assembly factor 2 [Burkholderiales bacterium]